MSLKRMQEIAISCWSTSAEADMGDGFTIEDQCFSYDMGDGFTIEDQCFSYDMSLSDLQKHI